MIEKMKFLSITGPMGDIDRVADVYLSRYEIQLENALSELKTVTNLRPFVETNPYKEDEQRARTLTEQYQSLLPEQGDEMDLETALKTVRALDEELKKMAAQKEELEQKRQELSDSRCHSAATTEQMVVAAQELLLQKAPKSLCRVSMAAASFISTKSSA